MSDPSAAARPVYIPRNKRKRVPDHTVYAVGTEDGWQPSAAREPLAAQDLMDERDFEEWGGATKLRREFGDDNQGAASKGTAAAVADLFTVRLPTRVGDKLLARLGWRPATGATLVAAEDDMLHSSDLSAQLLSKRRLRRIQLQQQRVRIPVPKLDTAGLGFDPHKDAPEFRAHRERMLKRRAEEGARRQAYHIDSVLGSGKRDGAKEGATLDDSDAAATYHNLSAQDFVGTTTAAGFALHDDDDDHLFDDQAEIGGRNGGKLKVNADDYEAFAYESADSHSEDERDSGRNIVHSKHKTTANASVFGDALSSWAGAPVTASSGPVTTTATAVTADGERPLSGFVLGGADHTLVAQRFRGPDLPPDYEVLPHAFGPHENPGVLQALAHAAKLAAADQQKDHALEQARIVAPPPTTTRLLASAIPGLSKIISDRFTAGGNSEVTPTEDVNQSEPDAIRITRSVQTFYPEPLLCKRFNIPALPKQNPAAAETVPQSREEKFFQDHVLSKVENPKAASGGGAPKPSTTRRIERRRDIDALVPDPLLAVERPEMEVFKSIFAVDESDQESDGGHDASDSQAEQTFDKNGAAEINGSAVSGSLVVYSKDVSSPQPEETRLRKRSTNGNDSSPERSDECDDDSHHARRRHKKHSKHKTDKKKKKKKRSTD